MPSTEARSLPPFAGDASPPRGDDLSSLTLVQIAERLDRVTSQIEAERAREREARARYREVADQVDSRIQAIKSEASALVREQQRRLASFESSLGAHRSPGASVGARVPSLDGPPVAPANISEAIVMLWTLPEYDQPMTTDEIAEALPAVGYESKAAPRSLRSAVNQALGKLCRVGKMQKYRQDGSPIDPRDRGARARRYKARE